MPDYSKSKIYKIESLSGGVVYYGSTINTLGTRLSEHKRNYRNNRGCYSRFVMCHDDYKIILIKNFPCESKEELREEEYKYINDNECVNKQKNLYRTEEYKKQYYKKWRDEHKKYLSEYNKKWRFDNKARKAKNDKDYYIKNKEHISRKFECECGSITGYAMRNRHYKTKKHISFIENNNL